MPADKNSRGDTETRRREFLENTVDTVDVAIAESFEKSVFSVSLCLWGPRVNRFKCATEG